MKKAILTLCTSFALYGICFAGSYDSSSTPPQGGGMQSDKPAQSDKKIAQADKEQICPVCGKKMSECTCPKKNTNANK